MALEKLVDAPGALKTYMSALPLIATFCSQTPTSSSVHKSHTPQDEFWNWTERLLRRAIIVSGSLETETLDKTMVLLERYRTCSAYWTRTFRAAPRCTIASIHLRALVIRASHLTSSGKPTWLKTASTIIKETREMLDHCPAAGFPKAGVRNTIVEDFVDLVVAVWEAGGERGEETGWVIDVSCLYLLENSYQSNTFESAGSLVRDTAHFQLFTRIPTYDPCLRGRRRHHSRPPNAPFILPNRSQIASSRQ